MRRLSIDSCSLKLLDIEMLKAKNGKEALQIYHQNPEIKLLLLNIQLPGMNGYEVLTELKKINPKLPIVSQTAYSMINEAQMP